MGNPFPRSSSGPIRPLGIREISDYVYRQIPAQPWDSDYGPYRDWLNAPVLSPAPGAPGANGASYRSKFESRRAENLARINADPRFSANPPTRTGSPSRLPAVEQPVPGLRTTPIVNAPGRAQTTAANLAAQQAGMPAINWTAGNPEFDAAAAAGAAADAVRAAQGGRGYLSTPLGSRDQGFPMTDDAILAAQAAGALDKLKPGATSDDAILAGVAAGAFDRGIPVNRASAPGGLPDTSNPATQAYWDRADIQAWANASPGNRKLAENLQRRAGFTPAQTVSPGDAASWRNMPTTRVAEAFGPGAPRLPVPALSDGREYAAGFNPANDVDTRVGFTMNQLQGLSGPAPRSSPSSLGTNQAYAAGFNPANDVDTRPGFTATPSLPAAADPAMRVAPAQSTMELTDEQRQAQWLNSNYIETLRKHGIGVG